MVALAVSGGGCGLGTSKPEVGIPTTKGVLYCLPTWSDATWLEDDLGGELGKSWESSSHSSWIKPKCCSVMSVCLYMFASLCLHICMHIFVCLHVCVSVHLHVWVCVVMWCIYFYVSVFVYLNVYVCLCVLLCVLVCVLSECWMSEYVFVWVICLFLCLCISFCLYVCMSVWVMEKKIEDTINPVKQWTNRLTRHFLFFKTSSLRISNNVF